MRRLFLLFAVLFVVPLFAFNSPKEYDDKTVNEGIEGTWRLVEREFNGAKDKSPFQSVTTYRSGTYSSHSDSNRNTARGSYRIDLTQQPPYFDQTPSNGPNMDRTFFGIYQIDGDTLKTAYFVGKNEYRHPQSFNDEDVDIKTYKRVK